MSFGPARYWDSGWQFSILVLSIWPSCSFMGMLGSCDCTLKAHKVQDKYVMDGERLMSQRGQPHTIAPAAAQNGPLRVHMPYLSAGSWKVRQQACGAFCTPSTRMTEHAVVGLWSCKWPETTNGPRSFLDRSFRGMQWPQATLHHPQDGPTGSEILKW